MNKQEMIKEWNGLKLKEHLEINSVCYDDKRCLHWFEEARRIEKEFKETFDENIYKYQDGSWGGWR